MTIPARPRVQHQGPANNCVIGGRLLGWLSCTAYAAAGLVDRSTLGAKRPTGCEVRARTGDTTGGLSLPQVAKAVREGWGVEIELHVGGNACSPAYARSQLEAGRAMVLQGSTRPLLSTPFRSTNGPINHCVLVNEVRGDEALVYDPAADGRRSGIDRAASWWPWSLVERFAADLQPWGEQDSRRLGRGRMYAGFGPDTEPHVHLRPHARRMITLPNRLVVATGSRRANVRSGPGVQFPVVMRPDGRPDTLPTGSVFFVYQLIDTTAPAGSTDRRWYGDHDGRRWVHRQNVRTT